MIYPNKIKQGYYDDIFTIWVQSAIDGELIKSSRLFQPVAAARQLKGDFIEEKKEVNVEN